MLFIGGTELYNTLRCILTLRRDDKLDPSVKILEATKMSLMGKESSPVIIRQDEELGLTFESYDALDVINEEEGPFAHIIKILEDGPVGSKEIMEIGSERGIGPAKMYRMRKKTGLSLKGCRTVPVNGNCPHDKGISGIIPFCSSEEGYPISLAYQVKPSIWRTFILRFGTNNAIDSDNF